MGLGEVVAVAFSPSTAEVLAAEFSPSLAEEDCSADGQIHDHLRDGQLRVLDTRDGHAVFQMQRLEQIRGVAWSPSGHVLAVGAWVEKRLLLLDSLTGAELARFPHDWGVSVVAWSPVGNLIAAGVGCTGQCHDELSPGVSLLAVKGGEVAPRRRSTQFGRHSVAGIGCRPSSVMRMRPRGSDCSSKSFDSAVSSFSAATGLGERAVSREKPRWDRRTSIVV